LAAGALLLAPLLVLAEHTWPNVWNNRLYQPLFQEEPNRHTPAQVDGTYLPPVIAENTTYAPKDGPLFLTGTTEVPTGVTLTLAPGVTVRAHEFGAFQVAGTLVAAGTAEQPITFTTNEVHPDNQTWSGLIVASGGRAEVRHAVVEYASPALTCQPGSAATVDHLHTRYGLVGVYTESAACRLVGSRLQAVHYGVVARGVTPAVTDTVISAGKKEILTTNY